MSWFSLCAGVPLVEPFTHVEVCPQLNSVAMKCPWLTFTLVGTFPWWNSLPVWHALVQIDPFPMCRCAHGGTLYPCRGAICGDTLVQVDPLPWWRQPFVDPLSIGHMEAFPWWNPIPIKGRHALVQVEAWPWSNLYPCVEAHALGRPSTSHHCEFTCDIPYKMNMYRLTRAMLNIQKRASECSCCLVVYFHCFVLCFYCRLPNQNSLIIIIMP